MRGTNAQILIASFSVALTVASLGAQQAQPDNTKVNTRDRAASEPTADRQSNTKSDVSITREIRRAIMSDKSLSNTAHNVKIITQHGNVTLKGPVRTEDEKKAVEAKAIEIAGADHVKSEVGVRPAKAKRKS